MTLNRSFQSIQPCLRGFTGRVAFLDTCEKLFNVSLGEQDTGPDAVKANLSSLPSSQKRNSRNTAPLRRFGLRKQIHSFVQLFHCLPPKDADRADSGCAGATERTLAHS